MICANCGEHVPQDARFCGRCGRETTRGSSGDIASSAGKARSKGSHKFLYILDSLALLAGLGLIGNWAIHRSEASAAEAAQQLPRLDAAIAIAAPPKQEPVKMEPARGLEVEPTKPRLVKTETAKVSKTEPAKNEPAKVSPAKSGSEKAGSAKPVPPTSKPSSPPDATGKIEASQPAAENSGSNSSPGVNNPGAKVDAGSTSASVTAEDEAAAARVMTRVEQLISKQNQPVRRCYERVAKQLGAQTPAGVVNVRFTVEPTGQFSNVQILNGALGIAELGDCMVKEISTWQLDAGGSDQMTFEWPFRFEPQ